MVINMIKINNITQMGGYSLVNGRRNSLKVLSKGLLGTSGWDYQSLEEAERECLIELLVFMRGVKNSQDTNDLIEL